MEIETFEIEEKVGEVAGTTPEVEEEAIKLIQELGLEGQKSLVVTPETEGDENQEVRIPYPEMSDQEEAVYNAILPEHTKIEDYSAGIIPLRVLQVASHARTIFKTVRVWHKPHKAPDPILVGLAAGDKKFLLARWGDVLKPFAELVEEAREIMREDWIKKTEAKIRECQAFLIPGGMDNELDKAIRGAWASRPFY